MADSNYPYVGPVAKHSGNGNLPIDRIVIHCTVGADGKGAQGTAEYFRSSAARGSAHSIVDSDETLICAADKVVCWHAPPNTHSYGIELCCSLSNQGSGHWTLPSHVAMMKRAAKLTAEKCLEHDIPVVRLNDVALRDGKRGITGHVDVSQAFHQSTHWDPGPYFPWDQFMSYVRAEYAALTGGTPPEEEFDMATAAEILALLKSHDSEEDNRYKRYETLFASVRAEIAADREAVLADNKVTRALVGALATTEADRYADLASRVQTGNDEERVRYGDYVGRFNAILAAVEEHDAPVVEPPKA